MSDKSLSPLTRSCGDFHGFFNGDVLDCMVEKENQSPFMHSAPRQTSQEDQAQLKPYTGTLDMFNNSDSGCVKGVHSGALSTPFGASANNNRSPSPFQSLHAKDSCGVLDVDIHRSPSATKETVVVHDLKNMPIGVWRDGKDMGLCSAHATVGSQIVHEKSIYSPKVFIGGLPSDLTDENIAEFFSQFGSVTVDWPHRNHTHTNVPPNGYVFLLFKDAHHVDKLVSKCKSNSDNLSMLITRNGDKSKSIQVRPWKLMDQHLICKPGAIKTRYTVFVGGVPRSVTAEQLGSVVYQAFGEVLAVEILVENGTLYPKGAAKVVFNTREAYTKAIALRFLNITFADHHKEMEVKPFLVENATCEGCGLQSTSNLCAHLSCLLYLCNSCWFFHHTSRHLDHHTPMTKCGNISSPVLHLPSLHSTSNHNRHNGGGTNSSPLVFPFPPPSSSSASRRSSFRS